MSDDFFAPLDSVARLTDPPRGRGVAKRSVKKSNELGQTHPPGYVPAQETHAEMIHWHDSYYFLTIDFSPMLLNVFTVEDTSAESYELPYVPWVLV